MYWPDAWTVPGLAYAAGIFEGEGTINANGTKYGLKIRIAMTDIEPLESCLSALNMGSISGPYKRENRKNVYSYNVCGYEKAQAVVAMLWPYLSPRRQEQCKTALNRYLANPHNCNGKYHQVCI